MLRSKEDCNINIIVKMLKLFAQIKSGLVKAGAVCSDRKEDSSRPIFSYFVHTQSAGPGSCILLFFFLNIFMIPAGAVFFAHIEAPRPNFENRTTGSAASAMTTLDQHSREKKTSMRKIVDRSSSRQVPAVFGDLKWRVQVTRAGYTTTAPD